MKNALIGVIASIPLLLPTNHVYATKHCAPQRIKNLLEPVTKLRKLIASKKSGCSDAPPQKASLGANIKFTLIDTLETGAPARGFVVADFNADGIPDLATARTSGNRISIFINKGDGTFQRINDALTGSSGKYKTSGLDAGDVDGDGDVDLVTSNLTPDTMSVLFNNGKGAFAPPKLFRTGYQPRAVRLADLDGDGDLDAVHTGQTRSSRVAIPLVLRNDGNGTFSSVAQMVQTNGKLSGALGIADFNGDKTLDLCMFHTYRPNSISILLNDGNGSFANGSVVSPHEAPQMFHPAIGDFDGDGDFDVAISMTYNEKSLIRLFLNKGDGTFAQGDDLMEGHTQTSNLSSVDVDGDGDLDLIAPTPKSGLVSVLLNSNGRFSRPINFDSGKAPQKIVFADFDQDGDLDLAISGDMATVTILRNDSFNE